MRLNNKGFAQWSLLAAIGMMIIGILLTIPRHNNYPDIAPIKVSKAAVSDSKKVNVKAGEEILILGAEMGYSSRDSKKQLMFLVQNAKGERDMFNYDIVSDEQVAELLPALKHSEFANAPYIFCRKTITRNAIDSIPMGITVFQMDSILVPTDKAVMEDGVLKVTYKRMEVFDKSTGKFFRPIMKFKDGKYIGCELTTYRKTHMNAWLLSFLPGTNWVYDHNIYNQLFQCKAFGKLSTKEGKEITFKENFFVALMLIVVVFFLFAIIIAFFAFFPLVPSYTFYGLLYFPPIYRPFGRTLTDIIVITLAVLSYYYTWLALMPYMSFFIMPMIFIQAAYVTMDYILDDDICPKCHLMNTYEYDHKDLLSQTFESRHETGSKEWTSHDRYQIKNYESHYAVQLYRYYHVCEHCGHIRTFEHTEDELLSKDCTSIDAYKVVSNN